MSEVSKRIGEESPSLVPKAARSPSTAESDHDLALRRILRATLQLEDLTGLNAATIFWPDRSTADLIACDRPVSRKPVKQPITNWRGKHFVHRGQDIAQHVVKVAVHTRGALGLYDKHTDAQRQPQKGHLRKALEKLSARCSHKAPVGRALTRKGKGQCEKWWHGADEVGAICRALMEDLPQVGHIDSGRVAPNTLPSADHQIGAGEQRVRASDEMEREQSVAKSEQPLLCPIGVDAPRPLAEISPQRIRVLHHLAPGAVRCVIPAVVAKLDGPVLLGLILAPPPDLLGENDVRERIRASLRGDGDARRRTGPAGRMEELDLPVIGIEERALRGIRKFMLRRTEQIEMMFQEIV